MTSDVTGYHARDGTITRNVSLCRLTSFIILWSASRPAAICSLQSLGTGRKLGRNWSDSHCAAVHHCQTGGSAPVSVLTTGICNFLAVVVWVTLVEISLP